MPAGLLPHRRALLLLLADEGFFDGMILDGYAALIDGCTRGCLAATKLPSAIPAIAALAVLCWLFTWEQFLFALSSPATRCR